jgi:hypothetical protein
LVKIIYCRHQEITSIVGTSSFPSTPCDHPTLFTEVSGRGVLGSSSANFEPCGTHIFLHR